MQIVIVDASRVVLTILTDMLTAAGHAVHAYTDSRAALDFLTRATGVRVLVTSLDVRPICGLELCCSARLLADARRPLHIIMMSSERNVGLLAEALDSGADDFIEKPPRPQELHARLRAAERLTTMQEELIRLAETDPLTGLLNRRAFRARLDAAVAGYGSGGALSLVLADIDYFKRINDGHGHDVGDTVIRALADLLAERGPCGRLGGEEFALILPGLDLDAAEIAAGRLRLAVRGLRVPTAEAPLRFTCSFGVACLAPGEAVEALVKRADVALYAAKTGGRDRVARAGLDLALAG